MISAARAPACCVWIHGSWMDCENTQRRKDIENTQYGKRFTLERDSARVRSRTTIGDDFAMHSVALRAVLPVPGESSPYGMNFANRIECFA